MNKKLCITVWNENRHERKSEEIRKVYPSGIHNAIADIFREAGEYEVQTATLDEPEHGLTKEVLERTDVLFWWGHEAHQEVSDEIVARVHTRVLEGMGLIVLHSSHASKIFQRLMGTSCMLKWREVGEKERLWVVEQGHPITENIGEYFELPHEEMYGEVFEIPKPDDLVFISWFEGGEVFRSGCCYYRGRGKIFYFRPGHESYPTYYDPNVRQVLLNAAKWAAPVSRPTPREDGSPNVEPLEEIKKR